MFTRCLVSSRLVGIGIFLLAVTLVVVCSARADDLPRYKLQVGQELVYRTNDPPREVDLAGGSKGTVKDATQWIVDVVSQDERGGWRLVFRQKNSSAVIVDGKEELNEWERKACCGLEPDGRLTEDPVLQFLSDPTMLFPPLPPDAASFQTEWSSTRAIDDTRRTVRLAEQHERDRKSWSFDETNENSLDRMTGRSVNRRYEFDRTAGFANKVVTVTRYAWDPAHPQEQTQTVELTEVRPLDPEQLAAWRDESPKYFALCARYLQWSDRADQEFAHAGELMDEAEAELKRVHEALSLTELRSEVENMLKNHPRMRQHEIEQAEGFLKRIGQPSPDWQTTDLEGNPRALADYRGQVVLLDFWYRGCGWCIRAMPEIKRLVDDFRGQNVTVLGMNNDRTLADAQFVIEGMALNYPSFKNGGREDGIGTKYGVSGWPTLVMLDGNGIVRHIHVGYTPNMRQELSQQIRELLAENKAAAK